MCSSSYTLAFPFNSQGLTRRASMSEVHTEDTVVQQLLRQVENEETPCFRIFAEDLPSAVFVGPGVCLTHREGGHSVVDLTVLGGIIATAEVQCSTRGLSAGAGGNTICRSFNYCWAVFTVLKRWVFIDTGCMSFF
jgi:hypothetical protein